MSYDLQLYATSVLALFHTGSYQVAKHFPAQNWLICLEILCHCGLTLIHPPSPGILFSVLSFFKAHISKIDVAGTVYTRLYGAIGGCGLCGIAQKYC